MSTDQEQRYTLDEARLILRRRECMKDGHDLHEKRAQFETVEIFCGRCGQKWGSGE